MSGVVARLSQDERVDLAADVRHYLQQSPRQLPSRGLYDALGSALFDAICELPWYPVTRAERRLISAHREAILAGAAAPRLVELGCGNGAKLDLLLGESGATPAGVRQVDLIDISPAALRDAMRRLGEGRTLTVVPHAASYERGLAEVARTRRAREPMLVLFLGSNIGNFDPPGAAQFLDGVRAALAPGDGLLLGADLVKSEARLLAAYDDPLGVTAAFNKNLLVHLNRTLGASFDLDAFTHRAVWRGDESRVEMHLVSRRAQRIDVPAAGLAFTLAAGEPIWTESSYKYRLESVGAMLRGAGFDLRQHWIDQEGQFLLALAAAV